jgi:hypothetical protein
MIRKRCVELHYAVLVSTPVIGSLMPLSLHEAEWLSLIRYQALSAVELSRQPSPLGGTAINGLQDAIEAFLRLCAEHLRTKVTDKMDFYQLFDAVDTQQSVDGALSGHRSGLTALNKARVGFKHHGNVPNPTTMERARANTQAFLEEACLLVLKQRFDDVSLTAFVRDDEARQLVDAASTASMSGNHVEAMVSLRRAFDRVVRDYEQRKVWEEGHSLFRTEPSSMPRESSPEAPGLDKYETWIRALDQRTKLLAFGVDLRRYAFFDAHAPMVLYLVNGGYSPVGRKGVVITEDIFRRCYRFVIDTALTLGAEDYDFDAWTAWRLYREADRDSAPGSSV